MTMSMSHANRRSAAHPPAEPIPALIGREKTLHDMTMKLYKRGKELEEQDRQLHEERGRLRNGAGEAMSQEEKAAKLAETEAKLKKLGNELRTVKEGINQLGEKQAPSDFKPSLMKGWSIAAISSSICLMVEGVVIGIAEYTGQLVEFTKGMGEWAFLGTLGIALASTTGAVMDRVYDIRSGISHNEKMVDRAVTEIFKSAEIAPTSANRKKARWMFMNNIRITQSAIMMNEKELWDEANEALTQDRPRDFYDGRFGIKISSDGTAIYCDGDRPIVVKSVEGFGVCDEKGEFTGFANYSSNNMNLTSLQHRLGVLKSTMMKELVQGQWKRGTPEPIVA